MSIERTSYHSGASIFGCAELFRSKSKTDACYNGSIQIILETLNKQLRGDRPDKALSVIFGTHNIDSLTEIFERLQSEGLASQTSAGKLRLRSDAMGRVNIAQLYGQSGEREERQPWLGADLVRRYAG